MVRASCIKYPFIPKSTVYMREGQFWHIPLSNGQFACGRVLQFDFRSGKRHSRAFLAGLIDWCGAELPTAESIAGCKLLDQGDAHIRTISWNHGAILGWRALEADGIEPLLGLSHMPYNDCMLVRGFETLRLATLQERQTLDIQSGWGLEVIRVTAEIYFVQKSRPQQRSPWDDMLKLNEFIRSRMSPPSS